jgi:acetyl-CoA C-acetyltransferase
VAGYTVIYMGESKRGIAVFDLPNGSRTVAYSEDPAMIERLESEECCGCQFSLSGGVFSEAVHS